MKCPKCGVACIPSRANPALMFCPVDGMVPATVPEPAPKRMVRIGVDMEVETEPVVERQVFQYAWGQSSETEMETPAVLLLSAEEIIDALARAYGFDAARVYNLRVTVEPPGEGSDQFAFTVKQGV